MRTGVAALGAALGLVVCAVAMPQAQAIALTDPTGAGSEPAPPWHVVGLPRQSLPLTRYRVIDGDGSRVLEIDAQGSYGHLVHELAGAPAHQLSWQWRIDIDNTAVDLRSKAADDHAVAVCASFDLPLAAVPFVERQMLRLAQALSGTSLPTATLCYTRDPRLARDTVLDSPYTRRVRLLVLHGSQQPLRTWQHEERDLATDFQRLFGDEASVLPPLRAVLVGADADNTGGRSVARVLWL